MDRNTFINFLKVLPPFYGCITDKFLEEIKLHKEVRKDLLDEFDQCLSQNNDKATWYKYLASMPSDSKNAKGQYRILKYFQTFPHCKIERRVLQEALQIKNDNFLIQFLRLVPKSLDSRVQYCLGECIEKNPTVKKILFNEISKEMKIYFLSCIDVYFKYRDDIPLPKSAYKKSEEPKLLLTFKDQSEAKIVNFLIPRSHLDNARTKNKVSSSRVPFSSQTDDLWNYLCEQSTVHEYTVCRNVISRFSDILAYDHNKNLITVLDNKEEVQIHANKVALKKDFFIIGQYPSNETTGLFLRCILQNQSHLVFDFTQDRDIQNLNRYYETGEYGGVRVKALTTEKKLSCGFSVTEIECFDSKDLNEDMITFYHLRFDKWKDHEIIPFDEMKRLLESAEKWIEDKGGKSPPIVHCNAGIGRAAVFICALHIRKEIKSKRIVSAKDALKCVADTIWSLRVQRGPDCVQTYAQVNQLIQMALNTFIK